MVYFFILESNLVSLVFLFFLGQIRVQYIETGANPTTTKNMSFKKIAELLFSNY